jgi:type IV secretory pathway ATPase VirB11/archaellum biosynthesis ATPase
MCNLYMEGTRAIIDLAKCPYEFASPEFLNLHLKDLSTTEVPIKTIRYEEEIVVELDEEKTAVLMEYAGVIRQLEQLLLRGDIYGMKEDPGYENRRLAIKRFYEYMFMNPLMAEQELANYNESQPEKAIYMKGYQTFKGWVAGIRKRMLATKLYQLVKQAGDFRQAFLTLIGLKSLYFVTSLLLDIPPNAVPMKGPEACYSLPFGINVQIYEVPGADAYLYVQKNEGIDGLSADLKKALKRKINEQFKESFENVDYDILMNLKTREYRQSFIDQAVVEGTKITPQQAMAMGRECAAWVTGLGAPIENLALDKENVTDIYIDSENSPIYIEHRKFGLCHTLFRYNRDLLERGFKNIVLTMKGTRKFDETSPIIDVVLKRLTMRCHLQRPPATFGELQGALRIMQEEPFTYAQYLDYHSMSPFFAGYDDVMVTLGCSEAVLGLKGVGKTSFTAAKISSIGTRRRILPIQDIEEIPVRAFRKRGFHIGAARVQSSDREESTTKELDLVSMANALLRMGDAALIINEVRSRVAVQGIINLLNTQPGVFLLYNLHAESLRDVQDRFELVFNIPAASMFATDRYTFLKKVKFGRKGRIYRVLGFEYESDTEEKKFVEVFRFRRGESIDKCAWEAKFLRNPEASTFDFSKIDIAKLEKNLDIAFIPPSLSKRCEETGISPEQYILQAFFKGKVYWDVYQSSLELKDKLLLELDFVLQANSAANKLLNSLETEEGSVDYKEAQKRWPALYKETLKAELASRKTFGGVTEEDKVEAVPAKKTK